MRDISVTGENTNLLAELNRQSVRYLIVGGVAVHYYAPDEREYDDLDVLLDPSPANAERCFVLAAAWGHTPLYRRTSHPSQATASAQRQVLRHVITPDPDIDFASELEFGLFLGIEPRWAPVTRPVAEPIEAILVVVDDPVAAFGDPCLPPAPPPPGSCHRAHWQSPGCAVQCAHRSRPWRVCVGPDR
jgi:hypothetical protein